MDQSLKATLAFFLLYGLVILYLSSTAKSKNERLSFGLFLIFDASFMLTGFAIAGNIIEGFSGSEPDFNKLISEFGQYIFMGSFIVTFLFGCVGTNIISSVVIKSYNIEVSNELKRIKSKLDTISNQPIKRSNLNRIITILNICLFIIMSILILIQI